MSYSEKLAEAQKQAFEITVNEQLSVHRLDEIHKQEGIIYHCNDGRIVDSDYETK